MQIEDCYQLGTIVKKHGLKGDLLIILDVDDPSIYHDIDAVFLKINEQLLPYFIEEININKQRITMKLEDVDTSDQADEFKGLEMYLPLKALPNLGDDKYYYHELIDMMVIDQTVGKLGPVLNVLDLSRQMLLEINYQEKEVLIPLSEGIIISVDKKQKEIMVSLPEGLLDVYLED